MNGRTVRLGVPQDAEGDRLDRFLTERMQGVTRSRLKRLIAEGRVRVDGETAKKAGLVVENGMIVEVEIPPPPPERPEPETIPVQVLHEDQHVAVVVKPAGMVVHPGHGRRAGTLVNALLGRGMALAETAGSDRPGIVHRLDRDTSGLLVVAKTGDAHLALSRAFARREVRKRYVALVWGHPEPAEGTVDRHIGRSRSDPTRMDTRATRGRARPAVTHYRVVESLPGFSLLDVRIETGRTHQIRVHLRSIHHPVVGDARYAGSQWKGVQDPRKRNALRCFHRLALHAAELAFPHPATGELVRFQAPLPEEFRALLHVLREG